jgi:hypothetical protein
VDLLIFAFLVPFVICLFLAREGHVRTAWWVLGGILVMTMMWVFTAISLSGGVETYIQAAGVLGLAALPSIVGGVAGILLGRRSA